MCTGLELAAAVSTGAQVGSAIMQRQASRSQARALRDQAEAEQQAAEVKAEKVREEAGRQAARARAAIAQAGASLDSPSAELINADIVRRGELDAQTIISDTKDRAKRLRASSEIANLRGDNALISGIAGAGGSAISTAFRAGWFRSRGDS